MSPEQLANNNLRDKYRYFMHHTDQLEMKAFFGLCYMRGLQKENYSDCDILWDDGIGHPIFAATMSKDRFKFLNRFICFDDRTTRIERTKTDKFAPFREFFEKWNERCSTVVNIGDYCTIDECLYSCRNRMPFKSYNPNKSAKYGINIK